MITSFQGQFCARSPQSPRFVARIHHLCRFDGHVSQGVPLLRKTCQYKLADRFQDYCCRVGGCYNQNLNRKEQASASNIEGNSVRSAIHVASSLDLDSFFTRSLRMLRRTLLH